MSQLQLTAMTERAAQIVADYVPQRVLLSIFGFMAIVNAYTMRHALDIAFTQFNDADRQQQQQQNKGIFGRLSGGGGGGAGTLSKTNVTQLLRNLQRQRSNHGVGNCNRGKRDAANTAGIVSKWTTRQQNVALSSFYVGYALSQIPGSRLAERFGGKWVLAAAMLATALLTLLTPLALQTGGPWLVIAMRFLMGLSEGPTYPALCELLVHWVPSKERGKLAMLALSGGQFAQILMTLCSTLLLRHFNWKLIFYFFGVGALLWLANFVLFCYNEPAVSPFIRPAEREYLLREIPTSEVRSKNENLPQPAAATPWRDIFTCAPIWALISATVQHDCHEANAVSVATQHLRNVKAQPLRTSLDASMQATMPALLNWLVSLISGWTSDFLVSNNLLTTTATRKFMTAIAALGPTAFTGVMQCFTCGQNKDMAAQLNCALGVLGTWYAGIQLTPLDLSPNYAATLMAVSNGFAALATSMTPYLESLLQRSPFREFRGIFGLLCTLLISGDVQSFNGPPASSGNANLNATTNTCAVANVNNNSNVNDGANVNGNINACADANTNTDANTNHIASTNRIANTNDDVQRNLIANTHDNVSRNRIPNSNNVSRNRIVNTNDDVQRNRIANTNDDVNRNPIVNTKDNVSRNRIAFANSDINAQNVN